MGKYRLEDLFGVPGLLSLSRLPLGAVFPLAVHTPTAALGIVGAAAVTDILDGWYARRFAQATATGAVVDAVSDKLFVATVVATLAATGRIPIAGLVLLATREIGELPLVAWWTLSRDRRRARAEDRRANLAGKAATVLQFATVGVALARGAHLWPLLSATGACGALAALNYWRRELSAGR
ncbi:MAG TPA: CDP-alcohol phosphatidyltransferase family protein [Lysobacter sp.]|jgi:phosphatidylglycerophosphate synthase|nr:CDP-alcohol phosphatidyltransferase family protein [Lysobacter sp.]